MLAKLQPNLHMRRKSSPAITGLDPMTLSQLSHSNHMAKKRHSNASKLNAPTASQIASRRLSSPPSLEKDQEDFFFSHHYSRSKRKDCDTGSDGSGSSLNKLSISGLNPSSSDLRSNTIISGHQVRISSLRSSAKKNECIRYRPRIF